MKLGDLYLLTEKGCQAGFKWRISLVIALASMTTGNSSIAELFVADRGRRKEYRDLMDRTVADDHYYRCEAEVESDEEG